LLYFYIEVGVYLKRGVFMRYFKEVELWKDVSEKEWMDWHWQVRNRITDVETLSKIIHITEGEKEEIQKVLKKFPMGITPYFATLMDVDDPDCPKGIEIMEALRGHISGFAVPTYVVDAPGGGGKIPIMPQYLISQSADKVVLRNYEGIITTYTEPQYIEEPCKCPVCRGEGEKLITGVAELLEGKEVKYLKPKEMERNR
jgi:L-lysine 2,3-aminomutase